MRDRLIRWVPRESYLRVNLVWFRERHYFPSVLRYSAVIESSNELSFLWRERRKRLWGASTFNESVQKYYGIIIRYYYNMISRWWLREMVLHRFLELPNVEWSSFLSRSFSTGLVSIIREDDMTALASVWSSHICEEVALTCLRQHEAKGVFAVEKALSVIDSVTQIERYHAEECVL